ncbi:MAG: diguanylate cyclase, partial [Lachnospiraceae bacterium]|nr:diguanylate cyclase [Lachnospiraceae bacterium]
MNNYTLISVLALCCYLFLFLTFAAAKKTKVINSFLLVLFAFLFWTGGSLLMRMEMWPDYSFWFHVSIIGLIYLPYGFYYFVHAMTESTDRIFIKVWFLVATINNVINLL